MDTLLGGLALDRSLSFEGRRIMKDIRTFNYPRLYLPGALLDKARSEFAERC